jgi:hypothetical protein
MAISAAGFVNPAGAVPTNFEHQLTETPSGIIIHSIPKQ